MTGDYHPNVDELVENAKKNLQSDWENVNEAKKAKAYETPEEENTTRQMTGIGTSYKGQKDFTIKPDKDKQ